MCLKQRNRGQDGTGISTMALDIGEESDFIITEKALPPDPVDRLFNDIIDPEKHRQSVVALSHNRYGIHEKCEFDNLHPVVRHDDVRARNLVIAGNCNFSNIDHQKEFLLGVGKGPIPKWDMKILLMLIGHFMNKVYWEEYSDGIDDDCSIDMRKVFEMVNNHLDGGYTLAGFVGSGDAFLLTDPNCIRPNCYACNDDVFVAASEDTAIRAAFGFKPNDIYSLDGGQILTVTKKGQVKIEKYAEGRKKGCMFERVYFSRDSTSGVHGERKILGDNLGSRVDEVVADNDFCLSYIPRTSQTAAIGLMRCLRDIRLSRAAEVIAAMSNGNVLEADKIKEILDNHDFEYDMSVLKDERGRTFIAPKTGRGKKVKRGYDAIIEVLEKYAWLIDVEDSIVKGTTLENTVMPTLVYSGAKNIIMVSSCPPIKYPCCYGIDMSDLGEFVAFKAVVNLLKRDDKSDLIESTYREYSEMGKVEAPPNLVSKLYDRYSDDELSGAVADIIAPNNEGWDGRVIVVYQIIEGLRDAIGNDISDCCLTGNYPTPGGLRVLRRSFMNYVEGVEGRAYD